MLNRKVGGVEGVESVVDALNVEMDTVEEVSAVINGVGGDQSIIAEDEIDEEFERLQREEREEKEQVERLEREERQKRERVNLEMERERLEEDKRRMLMEIEAPKSEMPGEIKEKEKEKENSLEVEETRKEVEHMSL